MFFSGEGSGERLEWNSWVGLGVQANGLQLTEVR